MVVRRPTVTSTVKWQATNGLVKQFWPNSLDTDSLPYFESTVVGCEVETLEVFTDEALSVPFVNIDVLSITTEENRYPNLTFTFVPSPGFS